MSQISRPKSPLLPTRSPQLHFTKQPIAWLYALWKFARPHTIIGTTLSVVGLYLIALAELRGTALSGLPLLLSTLRFPLLALIACLCGNVYIVGLNQLEDVEIDRVNKPHLPIASGEFSRTQGWWIVGIMGGLALLLSAWQSYYLMGMVWLSLLIGTAYSLPPVRLKRFPFWASLCIFTVRGAIVNLGLYLHFRWVLGQLAIGQQEGIATTGLGFFNPIPLNVWALTLFILVFTFAIAIFKDIPDLEGDRRYQITTFTLRLGARSVFNLARIVLTFCYGGMILVSSYIPGIHAPLVILTHLLALTAFWILSFRVNLQEKSSIAQFYQFIWKLFFLEYLIFPIACLLR